jgi:glycyl-tRNA synthetase beta chain
LTRTTTPKGEYLSLRRTTQGRPALEILPEILPGAILGLAFPKSMYWTEKLAPRFVRPIRWLVALLGEGKHAATVDFKILGVKTGNFTFGHRAKSRKALPVKGFKDYTKKLRQELVEVDYGRRRERIIQEAQGAAGEAAGKIVQDEWLVDWIANSTEWPRPMLGSFDERFLHLPREILITVMRDHQRYFAVEDDLGNLCPHFVTVLNMDSDEKGLIRQGHQRVLTARFRDAEFFWTADQRTPLRDRRSRLDRITYQAKLGSYGDKIRRMKSIGDDICVLLEENGTLKTGQAQQVMRAMDLCKCDLTTQMVQEFTELQGIVGGLYAKAQGEPEEIAVAVYDHYLPLGAEGASPRTLIGALVSLTDKVDSLSRGSPRGTNQRVQATPLRCVGRRMARLK